MTPQILEAVHDAIVAVSAKNSRARTRDAKARGGAESGANGVLVSVLARTKRAQP